MQAELTRRDLTRRAFLNLGIQLWAAVIGLIFAVPIVGYVLGPLFRHRPYVWRTAGYVGDLPYLAPRKFIVHFPSQNSWQTEGLPFTVYAVKLRNGHVMAISNICTHMQCPVRWDAARGTFLCPCHGGLYSVTGENIGGPPPKPLSQWVHHVDSNHYLHVQNRLTEAI